MYQENTSKTDLTHPITFIKGINCRASCYQSSLNTRKQTESWQPTEKKGTGKESKPRCFASELLLPACRRSLTVMRLCSGRLQASMWSWRSCCEKFWCICAASCASMALPQALFRSARQDHHALITQKHRLSVSSSEQLSYLQRLFLVFGEPLHSMTGSSEQPIHQSLITA